ncbi:hypothetical protein PV783_34120 [Chitinophaga sp. CC14]|uniref:hypothetical protein n=1 Tax=Chitinophaga sp. CC14 TaxID=3029199 RepID=UPI003B7FAF33
MDIDFGQVFDVLKKIKTAHIADVVDLAFPTYTIPQRMALEKQFDHDYIAFYMQLSPEDRSVFSQFLNRLLHEPFEEMLEGLKTGPITDHELKRPDQLQVIQDQSSEEFYITTGGNDAITLFNLTKASYDMEPSLIATYAHLFTAAYNSTICERISPASVPFLVKLASTGRTYLQMPNDKRMSYVEICETAFFICWGSRVDHDPLLIDLNALSENTKEKIVNNFGYTLKEPRRGKQSIFEKKGGNLLIAKCIFEFVNTRLNKGANLRGTEVDTEYIYK